MPLPAGGGTDARRSDLPGSFNWSREHLHLDPVGLDHVKRGVISQPRFIFFLEEGLEVPNKQDKSSSGGSKRCFVGDTSYIKMIRAIYLLSLEHESRFLGLRLYVNGISVTRR